MRVPAYLTPWLTVETARIQALEAVNPRLLLYVHYRAQTSTNRVVPGLETENYKNHEEIVCRVHRIGMSGICVSIFWSQTRHF